VREARELTPALPVADAEEEWAVPVAEPAPAPAPEEEEALSEPPLWPNRVVSTNIQTLTKRKRELTLAEGGAVGDDLRSVGAAGLVGAVTDTVGEVALVAEAGGISGRAAKGGGLGKHALHTSLL
jgi:hypothetical protein